MNLTINCSKVLPGFQTFDNGQKQPEVEALPCRGVSKIHPADNIALPTYVPLFCLFIPSEVLGKVLICDGLCTLQSPVGGEPLCETCLCDGVATHNLLHIVIIKEDHLLIFEMDGETIYRGFLLMQGKF
jgi:hypothetical protein